MVIKRAFKDLGVDVPNVGSWARRLTTALDPELDDADRGSWARRAMVAAGLEAEYSVGSWRTRLSQAIRDGKLGEPQDPGDPGEPGVAPPPPPPEEEVIVDPGGDYDPQDPVTWNPPGNPTPSTPPQTPPSLGAPSAPTTLPNGKQRRGVPFTRPEDAGASDIEIDGIVYDGGHAEEIEIDVGPDQSRVVRVRGRNSEGVGPWSDPVVIEYEEAQEPGEPEITPDFIYYGPADGESENSPNQKTRTLGDVEPGDLLIAVLAWGSSTLDGTVSQFEWTHVINRFSSAAHVRVMARRATGEESGATLSIVAPSSTDSRAHLSIYQMRAEGGQVEFGLAGNDWHSGNNPFFPAREDLGGDHAVGAIYALVEYAGGIPTISMDDGDLVVNLRRSRSTMSAHTSVVTALTLETLTHGQLAAKQVDYTAGFSATHAHMVRVPLWFIKYPPEEPEVVVLESFTEASGNSVTSIATPEGTEAGDLLVLMWGGRTGVPALASEWNFVGSAATSLGIAAAWWRFADGSEGETLPLANHFRNRFTCCRLSGVDDEPLVDFEAINLGSGTTVGATRGSPVPSLDVESGGLVVVSSAVNNVEAPLNFDGAYSLVARGSTGGTSPVHAAVGVSTLTNPPASPQGRVFKESIGSSEIACVALAVRRPNIRLSELDDVDTSGAEDGDRFAFHRFSSTWARDSLLPSALPEVLAWSRANHSSTSDDPLSLPRPDGVEDGDLLVLVTVDRNSRIQPPAGFTLEAESRALDGAALTSTPRVAILSKVASSEPVDYSLPLLTTTAAFAYLLRFGPEHSTSVPRATDGGVELGPKFLERAGLHLAAAVRRNVETSLVWSPSSNVPFDTFAQSSHSGGLATRGLFENEIHTVQASFLNSSPTFSAIAGVVVRKVLS
jgi:hypothetical protein